MIIFWRGWGWWVFFGMWAWIFALIGIMIGTGSHEPDEAKAAADTDLMFALAFALHALSVFFMARYQERRSHEVTDPGTGQIYLVPHVDEFIFIRMKYWTPVLVAVAVGLVIKSFFE